MLFMLQNKNDLLEYKPRTKHCKKCYGDNFRKFIIGVNYCILDIKDLLL